MSLIEDLGNILLDVERGLSLRQAVVKVEGQVGGALMLALQQAYLRSQDPDEREFDNVFDWSDPMRFKDGRLVRNGCWGLGHKFIPSASFYDIKAIVGSAIREQSGCQVPVSSWVRCLPIDNEHSHRRARIRTSDGRVSTGCVEPSCGGQCGVPALVLDNDRLVVIDDIMMARPFSAEWTGARSVIVRGDRGQLVPAL